MEHIVQFGITIDDEKIKQHVEEKALQQVVLDLKTDICCGLPTRYGRDKHGNPNVDWSHLIDGAITDILNDQSVRDEIVETAAKMLTDKVSRTKAWREKYKDIADI